MGEGSHTDAAEAPSGRVALPDSRRSPCDSQRPLRGRIGNICILGAFAEDDTGRAVACGG